MTQKWPWDGTINRKDSAQEPSLHLCRVKSTNSYYSAAPSQVCFAILSVFSGECNIYLDFFFFNQRVIKFLGHLRSQKGHNINRKLIPRQAPPLGAPSPELVTFSHLTVVTYKGSLERSKGSENWSEERNLITSGSQIRLLPFQDREEKMMPYLFFYFSHFFAGISFS